MALPRVVVVGLGPADADLVTVGALTAIDAIAHRFLRTARHPAASVLRDAVTFDHVYEHAQTLAEVYRTIVELLVKAAAAHGEVVYAVPG